jgi:hypothetical protein
VIGTGEFAMTTTTFGISFLIGAALSLHFRVWILIPFSGLAIVGTALLESFHGYSILFLILTVGLILAILQIGYFAGLLMRAMIASPISRRQKSGRAEKLSLP